MSPQSASRGPVERVYVERIHCPDTEQLAASVGGLGRTSDDLCLIFGIPSWLMPLRDRSGQRWQPTGKPYVVAATEVCLRFIGTCRDLGRTYSVYIQTRQVFLGRFNEARLHRFSSPPFGSPFIPFPSHTLVSSFLSCPPVFMSGHLIPFFVCSHIGPGLSVYVHFYTHLNTGFRSPRSLQ